MKHDVIYRNLSVRFLFLFLLVALTALLGGCGDSDSDDDSGADETTVTILHVNDVHSHLAADIIDLTLDGEATEAEIGGMARAAAEISTLSAQYENILVLHAGDAWLAGFIKKLDAPVLSANIAVESGNVLEGLFEPYIAAGRDGYDTFATVQEDRGSGTNTYLDYAMSFVNYVEALEENSEELTALPAEDHPIKSYTPTPVTDDSL